MTETFYQQVHRLRDGAIMVYRRGDTKQQVYQARLKVPGVSGYVIRSLRTRDLPTALNQAEDLFYELRAEQKLGMDVRVSGNLKFKDLWKRFYAAHETDAARKSHPDLRVLFTSGYTRDAIMRDGKLDASVDLLSKPFTYPVLAAKLREVLDRDSA